MINKRRSFRSKAGKIMFEKDVRHLEDAGIDLATALYHIRHVMYKDNGLIYHDYNTKFMVTIASLEKAEKHLKELLFDIRAQEL